MNVSLIDYTGMGAHPHHAVDLLIFTKNTRLEMKPGLMNEIRAWTWKRKMKELAYMANTIPSSWEFVHYTFLIENVTRAFTHQLVRTRTASFAQQTMRVLNVEGWTYSTGPTVIDDQSNNAIYQNAMKDVSGAYDDLIKHGAAIEDARGILPTNIHTNIVMSANLRTITEMIQKRSSPRVQGEYRDFISMIKTCITEVHNWAQIFFNQDFDKAADDLYQNIANASGLNTDERTAMVKLVDKMRAS